MADDDNVGIEYDEEEYDEDGEGEGEDDFLADMGADRYQSAPAPATEKDAARAAKDAARELKQIMLEAAREAKRRVREHNAAEKERVAEGKRAAKRADKGEPDDELFSTDGSPILGAIRLY